ncbi:MAG: hypothetical protein AB7F50_01670 [Fimbriimonadaceae bacterium]
MTGALLAAADASLRPGVKTGDSGTVLPVKRPSKKEIREAVEKLRDKTESPPPAEPTAGKLAPKKDKRRIRKQGV